MNKNFLCKKAINALENSYAPYSNCKVGAALLCKNGNIYTGCNIENASFSPTLCAERTAFAKAISEGDTDFVGIAVAGKKGDTLTAFTPCGVCRQVMMEFCNPETFSIFLAKSETDIIEYKLKELLPLGFGNSDLQK